MKNDIINAEPCESKNQGLVCLDSKRDKKKNKNKNEKKVMFDDIAGLDDVKEVMRDVIDQYKYPEKYEYFDIPPYRSLLLHGKPAGHRHQEG